MDLQKKQYFERVNKWDENLDVILDKECEYNVALQEKYQIALDELKNQLRLYFYSNNFSLIEKPSFFEATFGNGLMLIRVEFPEVAPDIHYKFKLIIVEESRREFFIYIMSNSTIMYIPKISKIRNRPKDSTQLDKSIRHLESEFIFLNDKITEINRFTFHYCFHSAQIKHDKIEDLKIFDDFLTILDNLLSN